MGAKKKVPVQESPQSEKGPAVAEPAINELPLENQPEAPAVRRSRDRGSMVGGGILIALGLLFLADNFIPRFNLFDYWPIVLIAIGAALLWKAGGR